MLTVQPKMYLMNLLIIGFQSPEGVVLTVQQLLIRSQQLSDALQVALYEEFQSPEGVVLRCHRPLSSRTPLNPCSRFSPPKG